MATLTLGTSAIREHDGRYSLNDLHQAAGAAPEHRPGHFIRNAQTQALIVEIENAQICALTVERGRNGGTYACRELVIAYAAWISPAFHLRVIRVFLTASTPQLVTGDQCASAASQRLREARFILSFDHEDRLQITPLDADACVLSPSRSSSMTTLVREYVSGAVLSDMLCAGIERLVRKVV
jgi:hypothetical protein